MSGSSALATTRAAMLPPLLSVYLDFVRLGAALVVVLHHCWPLLFPARALPWPGHEAVVVFFVLSGLVIAHATNRPGMTARLYGVHRAARVASVAVPALLLSGAICVAARGAGLGDAAPGVSDMSDAAWRLLANVGFVAQNWRLDVSPPLDAPFWSLNFEIWYYALFGAWLFLDGHRRTAAILAISVIAGPKILLLLPVWLLGVAVYWHRPNLGARTALAVFLLTALLACAVSFGHMSIWLRIHMAACWPGAMAALHGANQFLGDWLLGLLVAANFAAAACLGRFGAVLLRAAGPIRWAAGCTFSAYLYHMPLLAGAVLLLHLRGAAALLAVLAGVVALAEVSERRVSAVRRGVGGLVTLGRKQAVLF